ncbi:HTH-type transcriptional regulator CymR [Abditibacteriota bacterium]|nr:HTH-type transcriptional regulator CymR [Abditibacteriota bacterium]
MKISTRGEYGLRALMELGLEPSKGLSLRDIATRQNISLDYLEQIVPALKSSGLVKAKRGAQGGYQLAKDPAEITVLEALRALEGPFEPMICLSDGTKSSIASTKNSSCGASGSCAVQEVWRELQIAVESVLQKLTLAELLRRQEEQFGVPIRTYRERSILPIPLLN